MFDMPKFEMPKFEMPKFDQPSFAMPEFKMPEFKMPDLSGMMGGLTTMFKGLPNVLGGGGLMGGMLGGKNKWIIIALAIGVTLLLGYGAVKIAKSKEVHKTIRHAGGSITGTAKKYK